jgi:hypothetical protein
MGTVSEIYASALGASCAECYRKAQRIRELEAQLAAKWIDVKERPPEIGEKNRILAFVIDYEHDYAFQMVTNRWQSGYSNVMRGQKVTHWQPLPPPPSAVLEANNALAKAAPSDGGEG